MCSPTLLRQALFLLILGSSCLANPPDWDGPSTGPKGVGPRTVWFIAQDYRNGGISGVLRAFDQAAKELDWTIVAVDGKGEPAKIRYAFQQAIARKADAIILGGFQVQDVMPANTTRTQHPPLIGWHAGAHPGAGNGLFFNVSSKPEAVARMAVQFAMRDKAPIGAVLITDSRFDIASAKTKAIQAELSRCRHCITLTVADIAISQAGLACSQLVARLNHQYGKRWTHTLAINDIYFDEMNYPLRLSNRPDIRNIAAGDGSHKAISRVKSGLSQQVATVAEPLQAQGWQLADETNRALAKAPPSGYVSQPILVTQSSVGGKTPETNLQFKQAYRKIWRGQQ